MAWPIFSWISLLRLSKEAVVRHLLGQDVLEDVLQLGEELLLVDELQALEVHEMGFEVLPHAGDGLENAEGEVPADHRGHLHGSFQVLLEPVDPGGDDPLDLSGISISEGLWVRTILMVLLCGWCRSPGGYG